jgi:hypothetical protein
MDKSGRRGEELAWIFNGNFVNLNCLTNGLPASAVKMKDDEIGEECSISI